MHARQPLDLALGLGEHLGGGLRLLELLPELVELGVVGLALAELLLDRLDLLAEEVVALGLGDLRADLLLDLARELEHGELPGEELAELLEPGADVDLAQQLLLLLDRERQARAEQVGQAARLAGVHRGDLELLGHLLALVDHPLEEPVDVVHQGVELDPLLDDVLQRLDLADQVGLGLDDLDQAGAEQPLADDPGRAVGELQHLEDRADADGRVQVGERRLVGVGVALGDQADHLVADQDLVDQLDPARPVHDQRDDRLGEDDVGPQRQEREPVGERGRSFQTLGENERAAARSAVRRLVSGSLVR